MKIDVLKINSIKKEGRVRGYVKVLINDSLVIHNIRIISVNDKIFVAFPSFKVSNKNGERFVDIIHPINKETREMFNNIIIEAYNKQINEAE